MYFIYFVIIYLSVFGITLMLLVTAGELFTQKHEDSWFGRWWRNNIISNTHQED
jgi:hypothetical protein